MDIPINFPKTHLKPSRTPQANRPQNSPKPFQNHSSISKVSSRSLSSRFCSWSHLCHLMPFLVCYLFIQDPTPHVFSPNPSTKNTSMSMDLLRPTRRGVAPHAIETQIKSLPVSHHIRSNLFFSARMSPSQSSSVLSACVSNILHPEKGLTSITGLYH